MREYDTETAARIQRYSAGTSSSGVAAAGSSAAASVVSARVEVQVALAVQAVLPLQARVEPVGALSGAGAAEQAPSLSRAVAGLVAAVAGSTKMFLVAPLAFEPRGYSLCKCPTLAVVLRRLIDSYNLRERY